jgi:hypothetical protein
VVAAGVLLSAIRFAVVLVFWKKKKEKRKKKKEKYRAGQSSVSVSFTMGPGNKMEGERNTHLGC